MGSNYPGPDGGSISKVFSYGRALARINRIALLAARFPAAGQCVPSADGAAIPTVVFPRVVRFVAAPIATDAIVGALFSHGATPPPRQHFHDALPGFWVDGVFFCYRCPPVASGPR